MLSHSARYDWIGKAHKLVFTPFTARSFIYSPGCAGQDNDARRQHAMDAFPFPQEPCV